MLEKLKQLENKYLELSARAEQPDFYADPARAAKFLKEQRELEPIVTAYRAWRACAQNMDDALAMMAGEQDEALKALCQEEYQENKARREELEQQLKLLLLPQDPNDEKNVLMEIRVGRRRRGERPVCPQPLPDVRHVRRRAGLEAWSCSTTPRRSWAVSRKPTSSSAAPGACSRLKFESGVHRVQRVPETESGGRVHTSTATVAVLPEMEAGGCGASARRTLRCKSSAPPAPAGSTSTRPRPPSGSSTSPRALWSPARRSAARYRTGKSAWRMLASKLYEIEQERVESATIAARRSQVGSGMRNERIRTYNFPQGRVTDHRIGLTLYKLDSIMNGDLDEIIDALMTQDQADRLQRSEGGERTNI